jgi:hypothetical protein
MRAKIDRLREDGQEKGERLREKGERVKVKG